MFEKLRAFFECYVSLTDEQFDFIKAHFTPKKVRKAEFLIRAGEVASYGLFIAAGCLRTYTIDDKGKEHILQFSIENWWVGDLNSYLAGVPATYFVDAVEDSQVLIYDYAGLQKIMAQVPALAVHYQQGLQKHAAANNKRITAALSASAEERYADFLRTYPGIALRVPLHMTASYLGITPETLSRIRKQLSRKH